MTFDKHWPPLCCTCWYRTWTSVLRASGAGPGATTVADAGSPEAIHKVTGRYQSLRYNNCVGDGYPKQVLYCLHEAQFAQRVAPRACLVLLRPYVCCQQSFLTLAPSQTLWVAPFRIRLELGLAQNLVPGTMKEHDMSMQPNSTKQIALIMWNRCDQLSDSMYTHTYGICFLYYILL